MDFLEEVSYYNFVKIEKVDTIEKYNQFVNWVSGEFDLFLQEEYAGLKVYYPNGWFSINVLFENEKGVYIQMNIKSKSINIGKKIECQINTIFNNLNRLSQNIICKL